MPFTLEESGMCCVYWLLQGNAVAPDPFRVQEGAWPAWCPCHSPVGWQGVTATRECLGITPVVKFPLPPRPQGCWCTG